MLDRRGSLILFRLFLLSITEAGKSLKQHSCSICFSFVKIRRTVLVSIISSCGESEGASLWTVSWDSKAGVCDLVWDLGRRIDPCPDGAWMSDSFIWWLIILSFQFQLSHLLIKRLWFVKAAASFPC